MGMREILKGTVIYESGQKLNGLMMIMRGTAVVIFEGGSYELHNGDVIGLPDLIHRQISDMWRRRIWQLWIIHQRCRS